MIHIRIMQRADIPVGLSLSTQAGWNQTIADWHRFVALQPDGCWLAEWNGAPAGTVIVFAFGDVAWIAMMLVREDLRGQGIGRALMERALDCAEGMGCRSMRLDATPLGQPLYERLGFQGDFALTRFGGLAPRIPGAVECSTRIDVAAAGDLDAEVHAADRRLLIAAIVAEQGGWSCEQTGSIQGYCTFRPGIRAVQIGPCVAAPDVGATLLSAAMHDHAGQAVIIDVPDDHAAARELVRSWGLTPQRPLLRMTRGEPVHDKPAWVWASSGGEKG